MLNKQRIQSGIIGRMNAGSNNFNADQTLAEAAHHIERGEYIGARTLCESVLTQIPDDIDAQVMLGRIAMLQYRWQEAIKLFDEALQRRVDPWTLANLGSCYCKTGDLDQAEYCLRGAIELKPALTAAHTGLATVLHGRGDFAGALTELEIAAANGADDYRIDSQRGCTLAASGRYEESQSAFERAAQRAGKFVYPRLIRFDQSRWEQIRAPRVKTATPQIAFCTPDTQRHGGHVTLISCNPPYVRKYGFPFLRSYAEQAQGDGLLHLHIYDPDKTIITEVHNLITEYGLRHFVATTETSPFPPEQARQRKAYYACGRLIHMAAWLQQYKRPVLSLDVDFIVEGRLENIVAAAAGADIALNPRVPADSPWLDIIANIIVANPTPAASSYFSAVANYAIDTLEREPEAWLVDQSALYCVLAMMRRYATEPAVAWLAANAAEHRLWHLGHAYEHLLLDPRYRKYAVTQT
jgi:tetratricopeptide (TPR) repeat protein